MGGPAHSPGSRETLDPVNGIRLPRSNCRGGSSELSNGGRLRGLCSVQSAMRRLSLPSLPARSASELSVGCIWRAGTRLFRFRSLPPRRGLSLPDFHQKWLCLSQIKSEYVGDAAAQDWKAKNTPCSLNRAR